jgi:hypothetical protein
MTTPFMFLPPPRAAWAELSSRPPPRCPHCLDEGNVCEAHPEFPWDGIWGTVEGHADHGGIGMPCPACCSPLPEDGSHPSDEAFTPDWKRAP